MRTLWVFQLFEPLSLEQSEKITAQVQSFLGEWKAHGTPVPGHFEIRKDQFLIVQAQEDASSGCSVDRMYREIFGILEKCGARISGPENIFFKNGGGKPSWFHFKDSESLIANGKINGETLIYNSALTDPLQLDQFEAHLKNTWLSRFLPSHA